MKFEIRPNPLRGYQVGFYYQEGIRRKWSGYSSHKTQEEAQTKADYFNSVFPEGDSTTNIQPVTAGRLGKGPR